MYPRVMHTLVWHTAYILKSAAVRQGRQFDEWPSRAFGIRPAAAPIFPIANPAPKPHARTRATSRRSIPSQPKFLSG